MSNAMTLSGLGSRRAALQERVDALEAIQKTALPLILLLPDKIRGLIDAEALSTSALTTDGSGVTYQVGGSVNLTIRPFAQQLVLEDAGGNLQPLTLSLKGDFDRDTVLKIVGFADLAKRDGIGQTPEDWVGELNGPASLYAS